MVNLRKPANVRALLILGGLIFLAFRVASFSDGDFFSFYQSSRLLLHGGNPYSLAEHVELGGRGFCYPPGAIFLTLWAALIPYGFAMVAWETFCVILLMASIHLWTTFAWKRAVGFPHQVSIILACFIAPCFWALLSHTLIIPVLFFATWAVWLLHKRSSFYSGLASGMMLIKPHLTVLLAILLFMKAPRKGLFTAGVLGMVCLTLLPFFSGYRPSSDLAQGWQTAKFYATHIYVEDDQDVASNVYRLFMGRETRGRIQPMDHSESPVLSGSIPGLDRTKEGILLLTLVLWGVLMLKAPAGSIVKYAALALALGPLTSRYSHAYDGILLIPWVLLAISHASQTIDLTKMAAAFFLLNFFVLALWVPMGYSLHALYWTRMGWYATLYFLIGFPLLFDWIPRWPSLSSTLGLQHARSGQAIVEHLLMLALLTGLGFILMRGMIGDTQGTHGGGAIDTMSNTTAKKIAQDQAPNQ